MKRKSDPVWRGEMVCVNIPPGGDVPGSRVITGSGSESPPPPKALAGLGRRRKAAEPVNPFDVVCMRMIAGNASAIHDYLAADPNDAALADVAGGLARELWARVEALQAAVDEEKGR